MAAPSVLTFDAEGRAVDFEVWVDDLQLFLQCDRADGLSLFDLTSSASPAPPDTADSTVHSQWATRDAAARLAVRRHLPTTERAHFSQYKSAHTLYDAVVARYSSPATATLSRLFLPYLFPDLAAFPTVADLITHLRTSDTRYRAALPAEFCAKNPPPIYLTLYYVVTRLPDSLRVVRDHFLSVCPITLTVDLLEERLLAAEQSIVAVGASRGDPRTPIFEGCSPSPLLPSVASAAAADLGGFDSSCEAEIYAGAMAAQELRWLTYLLIDLGEQPRSPPVLYVDNKAMLALCREHRLEHRTKHIALRYFLARQLQQRGQLRLAYVASEANTADIFTKALPPGDHQRFCTMLGGGAPLNPTPAATTFMRKGVRDQAEVFSAIQAHLRHVEFKLQHGDVEGTLSNVVQVETFINKRFEVLLVADEAGFEAADRFQLYQAKSMLTSRSYKLAIADVAALKRARTGFARGGRLPPRDGETESQKPDPS
ncbi:unnamed protein product [Closterium sp. NIES-54]